MNNLLTQKFPIAAFALLFVLTMSCSHEPAVEPQEPGGTNVAEWNDSAFNGDAVMNQMTFCIGDGITVKRDATTRATTDIDGVADFETGDLVAVAVTQGTSAEEIKLYRVKSDGSLEYAGTDNSPLIWKSATTPTTIRAWSYGTSTNLSYTLDAPESFDYSLTANQQTNGYNELLYSKEAAISYATYSSSPIPLTFRHQLSRLVVNIEHDRTTTLTGTASMGDNVNNTFPITARFDTIGGGSWTPTAYGAITPKGETAQSGYEATYSAVIFPGTYAQNTKLFTLTNTDGDYVYAVSDASGQTLTAGNQYNYTILVKDDLCRRNPLWWVAQYNMASNRTSFVAAHSTSSQYVFIWNTAMTANVSGYHVPTHEEHVSIVPSDVVTGLGTFIISADNTLDNPYEYPEIACNIGGKKIAGSTSVFGKNADGDIYAVRFIGTPHASAWHYKRLTFPCNGNLIESYLLDNVTTLAEAKDILKNLASSSIFTGSLGAANANQTPESTIVTANCFVQRFFPACGYRSGAEAGTNGTAATNVGNLGYYWSSTNDGSKKYSCTFFTDAVYGANPQPATEAFSIRLFKDDYRCSGKSLASSEVGDIICAHGKAYSPTTGSLPCGGQKVAIVAYKGNGEDNNDYNRGLAIALQDVGSVYRWYATDTGPCLGNQYATLSDALTDYKGIESTNRLVTAACGSGHVHAAAQAARNYENTIPHPNGTSQWFLPTMGQWDLIIRAMTGYTGESPFTPTTNNNYKATQFDVKIIAAGGSGMLTTNYGCWTSTEQSATAAWVLNFQTGYLTYGGKASSFNVRAVLAF
jgi:hypothetical protein